jgi:hypothetical protein
MADYPTSAMAADGRQTVDSALEAVENMVLTANDDFEGKLIVVSTYLADRHERVPLFF